MKSMTEIKNPLKIILIATSFRIDLRILSEKNIILLEDISSSQADTESVAQALFPLFPLWRLWRKSS